METCSAVFDSLAIDGLQALGRSRYETPHYTFQRLNRRVQSAVLIHEALHTAGLSEAPLDPDAMSAVEIETMVEEACGLKR